MKAAYSIWAIILFCACHSGNRNSEIFTSDGTALHGYDVVAFHIDHKAIPGSDTYTYKWNGATWQFSSSRHLDSFKLDPKRYAPQYGGYCAYGTAEGHKAPTEPGTWTIVNGKLYFNYNDEVKKMWMKDQQAYINKADKLWPTVKDDEF